MNEVYTQTVFEASTSAEVAETIFKLKNKKSVGYDKLSTRILKDNKYLFAPVLLKLFNDMITTGVYPSKMKITKIIPIHKGGSKLKVKNTIDQ